MIIIFQSMKMKMKRLCMFLLILVLLEVMCSTEGCWKQEREALLGLNSLFGKPLISWVDGSDCCQWEGVECNNTTSRVTKLNLVGLRGYYLLGPWQLNYSDFIFFKDLKSLDLSENHITGCAKIEGLENLQVLDLSDNNLDNAASTLSCLNGLSALRSLHLSYNGINATSFHVFETLSSKLLHLEVLDISGNELTNDILPSLGGFTCLKELYLSQIGLDSDLHIQGLCSKLTNLEVLHMANNNFNDSDIASALSGLNLRDCQLTSRSILNISKLRSLKTLDLAENQLNESILWSLENDGFAWPTSLQVLGLSLNSFSNNFLSSLRWLRRLKSLDLSGNQMEGSLNISDFRDLSNIEHLILDNNFVENEFLRSIGELTSLKVLSLSDCQINGTLPAGDWSKLKKLEELDLSTNEFVGPLPSSFVNMTSLRMLKLSNNYFTGNIGSNLASFTSLEYLCFEGNQFEVPISFTPFANHSNIKFIYGEGNRVILDSQPSLQTWIPKFQLQVLSLSSTSKANKLPLPNFLLYQYNLTSFDCSSCKLEGDFPIWLLKNNTKMTQLFVRNCSFTGTFQLPSRPLLNIRRIDVSDNVITGQIPSNNISSIFPTLQILNMSINDIPGSIPYELGQLNFLDTLDLSQNHLSGEIPKNISGDKLKFLKLSNNTLDGPIFPILSTLKTLKWLYLDGNSLSGSIPSSLFNTSLSVLDISNNHFVGKLPNVVGNLSYLMVLSMSNNHLQGSIPTRFVGFLPVVYLDMSQNNFTGPVPSFANSSSMRFIHLNNNKLSGLSKGMFTESSNIVILDLRYNEITSNIHNMIQDLSHTWLKILLLKGNQLSGKIPKQICQLRHLTILDLSHNNFSGPIPSCLGKISFGNEDIGDLYQFIGFYGRSPKGQQFVIENINFTTKKRSYTYTGDILAYMSGLDLSCNKLNGSIPSELRNLTKIRALNLSHNDLTGLIPIRFSSLKQIESLDLSFNKLSSKIPPQLNELTSLAVFSVAHNNLSGPTPERKGQFITFDESSYEGNPFLCGPPLPKSCNPYATPLPILPNIPDTDDDNDGLVDMYVFCVSFVASYTLVLLIIVAVLYINPYWRRAWFYYIELVSMNCYYFIQDNLQVFK